MTHDDLIFEMEEHVKDASTLLDAYSASVPIDGWATADLVKLSTLIDVELQERAYLENGVSDDSEG